MLTYTEAVKKIQSVYTDRIPTGNAYQYKNDYYIEMAPKWYDREKDGMVVDGYFKVDFNTGKVSVYNPIVDGIHDITKIKII